MEQSILPKGCLDMVEKNEWDICIQTLIIQALIQKLCSILVKDYDESLLLNEIICKLLITFNLVDEIYDIPKFEQTSKHFNPIFAQIRNFIVRLPTIKTKITTAATSLIVVILQLLCASVEPNPDKYLNYSHRILKRLFSLNLLDETYDMDQYEMLRDEFKRLLYHIFCIARDERMSEKTRIEWPIDQGCSWSKYHHEFIEVEQIAKGGFGRVFKVRHKLDNNYYAVKKITLKLKAVKDIIDQNLMEVTVLARLNHSNIVMYRGGWIEFAIINCQKSISDVGSSNSECDTSASDIHKMIRSDEAGTSGSIQFKEDSGEQISRYTKENKQMCSKSLTTSSNNSIASNLKIEFMLFIQMNLGSNNLADFLKEHNNNPINLKLTIDFFNQIINATRYIHSLNIVHHDIKPPNIFIYRPSSRRIILKLGDFGLACQSSNDHSEEGFGTPLYSAPEQLNDGICDKKNDIYSLGVILLELLTTFTTETEKARTIMAIREGTVPDCIDLNFQKLLKRLLHNSPNQRPHASQLVNLINKMNFKDNIFHERINKRNIEIKKLKEENKKLEKQILKLQNEKENLISAILENQTINDKEH